MTGRDHRSGDADGAAPSSPVHASRQQLIWDVIRFQIKLLADGVMDLLLSPMSIAAGVLGLIAGGDDPHRYFRRLQRLGRRADLWLNLFGTQRRRGTADDVMDDLRERVFSEAPTNPWLNRATGQMHARLDAINAARAKRAAAVRKPEPAPDQTAPETSAAPADGADRPARQPQDC